MKKVKREKRLLDTSTFLPDKGVVELVPTKHGRRGGFWEKFNSLSWPGESMCRKWSEFAQACYPLNYKVISVLRGTDCGDWS